ncbi:hypothetical protein SDC9_141754 [bioreactor metagenome]|uniref:Uncharacterized protein n=1 Tax=bioreactor metagenome TaxID=1076179 RepID=A0A645DZ40_9ZZZZ
MGVDLPLRLRAHPALRDRAFRPVHQLLDLRHRRLQAADADDLPGAGTRPEAVPATGTAQLDLGVQERAGPPRGVREPGAARAGGALSGRLCRLPASAAGGRGVRLRRPDHGDRPAVPRVPGGPREVPAAVPPRAGRRVPGHQPRPVRAGPRTLRAECGPRPGGAGRGRDHPDGPARADGRRRLGPVDLRLPGRDDPQHPRLREGLPGGPDDPAGAELPLHPDRALGRQRGDREESGPPEEAAVVRRGPGGEDRRLRGRHRTR